MALPMTWVCTTMTGGLTAECVYISQKGEHAVSRCDTAATWMRCVHADVGGATLMSGVNEVCGRAGCERARYLGEP